MYYSWLKAYPPDESLSESCKKTEENANCWYAVPNKAMTQLKACLLNGFRAISVGQK